MSTLSNYHQKIVHVPYVNQKGVFCLYNFRLSLNDQHLNQCIMSESQTFFTKMVDELIEFSEYDPELSDGIRWLDGEAQKKGLSFYDMVYQVLYKHDVNSKAKEWLNSRN